MIWGDSSELHCTSPLHKIFMSLVHAYKESNKRFPSSKLSLTAKWMNEAPPLVFMRNASFLLHEHQVTYIFYYVILYKLPHQLKILTKLLLAKKKAMAIEHAKNCYKRKLIKTLQQQLKESSESKSIKIVYFFHKLYYIIAYAHDLLPIKPWQIWLMSVNNLVKHFTDFWKH